jgi:excisionase family DNA binding protein
VVTIRKSHEKKRVAAKAEKKAQRSVENPMGRVLTSAQVAEMLQLSIATIQRAIRSGALNAHRAGRVYRINEEDMRAWWDTLSTSSKQESHDA